MFTYHWSTLCLVVGTGNPSERIRSKEPALAIPYSYLRHLPDLPSLARQLTLPTTAKRESYLGLANAMLRRFPTETTRRSVNFLVRVCDNTDPGPLANLPWYTANPENDEIRLDPRVMLHRLAPAMKFRATLRGRG